MSPETPRPRKGKANAVRLLPTDISLYVSVRKRLLLDHLNWFFDEQPSMTATRDIAITVHNYIAAARGASGAQTLAPEAVRIQLRTYSSLPNDEQKLFRQRYIPAAQRSFAGGDRSQYPDIRAAASFTVILAQKEVPVRERLEPSIHDRMYVQRTTPATFALLAVMGRVAEGAPPDPAA